MKIKRKRFIEEFCRQHCKNMMCREFLKNPCGLINEINNTFKALKKKKEVPVIEVDWNKISNFVHYIAMDKNGEWFGYRNEPAFDNSLDSWYNGSVYSCIISPIIKTTGKLNWKKSLIKRPVIAGGKE